MQTSMLWVATCKAFEDGTIPGWPALTADTIMGTAWALYDQLGNADLAHDPAYVELAVQAMDVSDHADAELRRFSGPIDVRGWPIVDPDDPLD